MLQVTSENRLFSFPRKQKDIILILFIVNEIQRQQKAYYMKSTLFVQNIFSRNIFAMVQ